MNWKKKTLTTADNELDVAFTGRGSIYAEGTFGGGSLGAYILFREVQNGPLSTSNGFVDQAIDGADIKSIDCPTGAYRLKLEGSTGASVDVYYNGQETKID